LASASIPSACSWARVLLRLLAQCRGIALGLDPDAVGLFPGAGDLLLTPLELGVALSRAAGGLLASVGDDLLRLLLREPEHGGEPLADQRAGLGQPLGPALGLPEREAHRRELLLLRQQPLAVLPVHPVGVAERQLHAVDVVLDLPAVVAAQHDVEAARVAVFHPNQVLVAHGLSLTSRRGLVLVTRSGTG
jgi:hypothetical protein